MSKETCSSCHQEIKWLRQRSNRLAIILSVALIFTLGALLAGCKEKSPLEKEFDRKCEISLLEEKRSQELLALIGLPEQEYDKRFKEIWLRYDAKLKKARSN